MLPARLVESSGVLAKGQGMQRTFTDFIERNMFTMRIGYTTGVFDLFHIGHLNLLRNARALCDKLIVGVTTDDLSINVKGKQPIITFAERIEIVRSCRYVDMAIPQMNMDKVEACKKIKANVVFVGDDWYGTKQWREYEYLLSIEGIPVVYLPYTANISSTKILERLKKSREDVCG